MKNREPALLTTFLGGFLLLCLICGALSRLGAFARETPVGEVRVIVTAETIIPQAESTTAVLPPFRTAAAQPTPSPLLGQEATACVPPNERVQARVVEVIDGDTIEVEIEGQSYRVRYIGIDTPESTTQVEYFGREAAARNAGLVAGQVVTLVKDVSETDRFSRLLRYVFVGEVFVNHALVRLGYANAARFPPDIACEAVFSLAEAEARSEGAGLWAGEADCDCSGPDLDCGDFQTQAEAQACYSSCQTQGFGDVFRLDGEQNDGRACESLP